MKKMLFILFATVLLLSMTACNGYNGIMREHLSNEELSGYRGNVLFI